MTGISKTYGRQTALREVSLAVASGEIVGLVGPNGAGKSTTLRIVCESASASSWHSPDRVWAR